jgi:thiol-disulfide isomerase/thioredoxin
VRKDDNDPEHTTFERTMTDPRGILASESGASLSGNERNLLYLNRDGLDFQNVSGVSGLDDAADARAAALLDYDRDGWQDVAMANANAPLLQLFRNQMGDHPETRGSRGRMLALRFVGANRRAEPSPERSTRDGYGAVAEIAIGDITLVREHRCGEGMASQNSATLRVGIGDRDSADRVRVKWPSGREQEISDVAAGSLVTVYEDTSKSPDGSGFAIEPYRRPGVAERVAVRLASDPPARKLALAGGRTGEKSPVLRLVTTMATWCAKCKGELPQIARLRENFGPEVLDLLAVPVDRDDDAARLDHYVSENIPAYQLLRDLSDEQISSVQQVLIDDLRVDALPGAIVTDGQGRILRALWYVPSVSEIRELLNGART